MNDERLGRNMYRLAEKLFPICRSLTGDGVRRTLELIRREVPALEVREVPSGTPCFDWEVPPEWNIRGASVIGPDGKTVVDFKDSNLHVVGYSIPVDKTVTLKELQGHLHSLPDKPDAIPYVTSYYKREWGFCLTEKRRRTLKPGKYRVRIDSTLAPGHLTYGELRIPGESKKEVFLSTYVCHPSMANNEVSGPAVAAQLAKWLRGLKTRRYSYRLVFIPETIGSILYLSLHLEKLKKRVAAGFNLTCVGDDRAYSYLPSRAGDTLADRAALHVLRHRQPGFKRYTFLDRGSDERQYCSPGVDLPVATVMRSKYNEYPEYHSSKDDLSLVTPSGLLGAYRVLKECLEIIESNETLRTTVLCEPQLGRRGLYPTLSKAGQFEAVRDLKNLIAYCDGTKDLLAVAELIGVAMGDLLPLVARLKKEGLLAPASAV